MKSFKEYIINEWKLTNDSDVDIPPEIEYYVYNYEELEKLVQERYEKSPKYLDLRDIDVSEVTLLGRSGMNFKGLFFCFTKVETIDITGWDTSKVKKTVNMFHGCKSLKHVRGLDNLDFSSVKDMSYMFYECESLKSINVSKWNTNKVTDMDSIFGECFNLKEIKGINNLNVKNLKDIRNMFHCCRNLERIDLTNFSKAKPTNMIQMFCNCKNLKEIKGIENWNISEVNYMNYMFLNCDDSIIPSWYDKNEWDNTNWLNV